MFSLRIGHALREACFGSEPYSLSRFQKDVLAGATVGVIAIPLAMALAIASGVAPQYGLYTAIIGGFVIALTGGGPGYATDMPATFMYSFAFQRSELGVAAASAIMMLMTVVAIIVPYLYSELRRGGP